MVGFRGFDNAGCMDDKKSTSDYIFMMVIFSGKSVKQTLTASSTMEAEYMVCYEATCHVIWLQKLHFIFGGCSLHF